MSIKFEIRKDNADKYFKEIAKELKKLKCREKIEIVVVGGASVVINYSFRNSSIDIDAFYQSSILKQAINNVTDKLNLPNDWFNKDFVFTSSFTPKLYNYSEFYKEYLHILQVRMVTKEYLIAMKLVSFRKYKNDIIDIVGILKEDPSISLDAIKTAVINLYDTYDFISSDAKNLIEGYFGKK